MIPQAALYRRLVDCAAMFPPKAADLETALRGHLEDRRAPYREHLGPLLVPSAGTADLIAMLDATGPQPPVQVGVIASGDPADSATAIDLLNSRATAEPTWLELRLDPAADPCNALTEAAATCSHPNGEGSHRLFCEVPHGWLDDDRLLDAAASAQQVGAALKLRTGGTAPAAFPTVEQVARFVSVCAGRGLAFKCTAGLHRAVRNHDPETGLLHHGFANILLATRLALDGGPESRLRAALEERDSAALASDLAGLDARQIAATRRTFHSFGSCDVATPSADIDALILARHEPASSREGAP